MEGVAAAGHIARHATMAECRYAGFAIDVSDVVVTP